MPRARIRGMAAAALLLFLAVQGPEEVQANEAANKDLAQSNNLFALELYQQLHTSEGNLFLSPYSISTALAMVYGGARGATESQMASTLHFSSDQGKLHASFAALEAQLNTVGDEGDVRLHVANAIWPNAQVEILPAYLDLVKKYYGTSITALDYAREPDKACETINGWVEDETENRIKDLILPSQVDPTTAMVLTNAIYFKGDWISRFDEKATREAPFYLTADRTVRAPMMRQEATFRYARSDSVQFLELPYKGGDLSMLLLLPEQGRLADLEQTLNPSWLSAHTQRMMGVELLVIVPRFKMTRRFELVPVLTAMGMHDAFMPRRADFSGMYARGLPLFISDVVHKAFVEVNEEGTEAAAATGIGLRTTSAQRHPEFNANRPFMFLIRANGTGSILFIGRVVDPTAPR